MRWLVVVLLAAACSAATQQTSALSAAQREAHPEIADVEAQIAGLEALAATLRERLTHQAFQYKPDDRVRMEVDLKDLEDQIRTERSGLEALVATLR
jgi:hypothetical protein